jgi:hypothetical protein
MYGAEQHRIAGLRQLDGGLRQGGARQQVGAGAHRRFLELEIEPVALQGLEHLQGLGHDLHQRHELLRVGGLD